MSATTESAWIQALISGAYAGRHATKRVARDADVPTGTARGWLAGRFTPSTAALIRLARSNDELRAELIRRLEEAHEETRQLVLPLDAAPMPAPRGHMDGPRGMVARSGALK